MRILLLLPYAWDTAPSQRYRIEQWSPWLRQAGIEITVQSLLTQAQQRFLNTRGNTARKAMTLAGCLARRFAELRDLRGCDAVWLHRAAAPVGPPVLERMLVRRGVPLILDFDDAIYLSRTSRANRRWQFLKWAHKTAEVCRLATHVTVGNAHLAAYARQFSSAVTISPTTVDTDVYRPRTELTDDRPLTVGWSGSPSTVQHLRLLDSVLRRVAEQEAIRLHVIGVETYPLEGVATCPIQWRADRQVAEAPGAERWRKSSPLTSRRREWRRLCGAPAVPLGRLPSKACLSVREPASPGSLPRVRGR
jgi:hypothetical protein